MCVSYKLNLGAIRDISKTITGVEVKAFEGGTQISPFIGGGRGYAHILPILGGGHPNFTSKNWKASPGVMLSE